MISRNTSKPHLANRSFQSIGERACGDQTRSEEHRSSTTTRTMRTEDTSNRKTFRAYGILVTFTTSQLDLGAYRLCSSRGVLPDHLDLLPATRP
jgi:hypothetical protein